MGKQRRKFDVDFKKQLVRELESGVPLNELASRYQIYPSLIPKWQKHFNQGLFVDKPSGRELALEKELERYKTKVAELVMEIEHLKKLENWIQRQRKLNTSVITAKNLGEFQKDVKS
jgi:transposase-like protein